MYDSCFHFTDVLIKGLNDESVGLVLSVVVNERRCKF